VTLLKFRGGILQLEAAKRILQKYKKSITELYIRVMDGYSPAPSDQRHLDEMRFFAKILNTLPAGSIMEINCTTLINQENNFLFYTAHNRYDQNDPISYDILFLKLLYWHLRRFTILNIEKNYLKLSEQVQKEITRLKLLKARQYKIKLDSIDLKSNFKNMNINIDSIFLSLRRETSIRKKMDSLTSGLGDVISSRSDIECIDDMIYDQQHERHEEVKAWAKKARYNIGNTNNSSSYRNQAKANYGRIMREMKEISGIPFQEDFDNTTREFEWYTLSTNIDRSIYFQSRTLYHKITNELLDRKTYQILKAIHDVESYKERMKYAEPSGKGVEFNKNVANLISLYLCLEKSIEEFTRPGSDIDEIMIIDKSIGIATSGDLIEAKAWKAKNLKNLLLFRTEILQKLKHAKANYPEISLDPNIQNAIKGLNKDLTDFSHSIRQQEEKIKNFSSVIELFIQDRQESSSSQNDMANKPSFEKILVAFEELRMWYLSLDSAFFSFTPSDMEQKEEHENLYIKLEKLDKDRTELINLYRKNILSFYNKHLYAVDTQTEENLPVIKRDDYLKAFQINMNHIAKELRNGETSLFSTDKYRSLFQDSKNHEPKQCLQMLDRILKEIRSLPSMESQIKVIISKFPGDTLDYKRRERVIMKTNYDNIELYKEIRKYMRELILDTDDVPKRILMEVFGIVDFHHENLRDLFRLYSANSSKVYTEKEILALIEEVDKLQEQIYSAQSIICDQEDEKREASKCIAAMKKNKLFPLETLNSLEKELNINKKELSNLLEDLNNLKRELFQKNKQLGDEIDLSLLDQVLHYDDIREINEYHNLLPSVTTLGFQDFARRYKDLWDFMDQLILYKRSEINHAEIRTELLKEISKNDQRVYRRQKSRRYVKPYLRLKILELCPEYLELEASFLCSLLNYTQPAYFKERTVVKNLFNIFDNVRESNLNSPKRRELRRVWPKIRDKLENHKPRSLANNFTGNRKKLISIIKSYNI
jgi:hypothetical protein